MPKMPIPLITKQPKPDAFDVAIDKINKSLDDYETKKAERALLTNIHFGPTDGIDMLMWLIMNSKYIFWTCHILATIIFFPLLLITVPIHIGFNRVFGDLSSAMDADDKEYSKLTKELVALTEQEEKKLEADLKRMEDESNRAREKNRTSPDRYCDHEDPYVFNPDTMKFEIRKK